MSDPELFLFFFNSWVLKFLRVAKGFRLGFRLALTNYGGANEAGASACRYIVFRCVGISESLMYCVLSCNN